MISPLVILDSHTNDPAAKFLADNVKKFKLMGYNLLLLAIDKKFTLSELREQAIDNIELSNYVKLYDAFVAEGIKVKFYNPFAQSEYDKTDKDYAQATNEVDKLEAKIKGQQLNDRAGQIMSEKFLRLSSGKNVIHLGGLEYTHFVKLISESCSNTKFVILNDDIPTQDTSDGQLYNTDGVRLFLKEHFGDVKINFIPLISRLSLEYVQNSLGLTSISKSPSDYIIQLLSDYLNYPLIRCIDQLEIISARAEFTNEKDAIKHLAIFGPKLPDVFLQIDPDEEGKYSINIPGINTATQSYAVQVALNHAGLERSLSRLAQTPKLKS